MNVFGLLLDLDLTLIDSQAAAALRKARQWRAVYGLIPSMLPYDGALELIRDIREQGVPVCIVTSSPSTYCTRVLRQWECRVDATVCYHDTKFHKPHPEPLLLGIRKLGVKPENTISVGDDAKDITASRAAGITSIAATWGSTNCQELLAAEPEIVCHSVTDLHGILAARFALRSR